jgi:excisionase family DNA binding protein
MRRSIVLCMTQTDRKLTASEVARRLDVTSETVRDWGRTGKLRAIRLPSGRMKFRESDVDAIERGEQSAA